MIRYTLKCSQDHVFESWFANAEGFEKLKAAGHVSCAICGDSAVEKTLMAPAVAPKGNIDAPAPLPAPPANEPPSLAGPSSPQEVALQKFKEHLEANSEHVGKDFAKKARAIHDGDEPNRAIHGEASFDEAKSLVEDGVPVAPLPFMSPKRTN
ncbi:MAG: DUF1178 family protein [Pseudomonadota bacterium]